MRRLVNSRIVLALVVCTALISAAGVWARKANHGISQLSIGNKTRALLVESVVELGTVQVEQKTLRRFKVTVKNGYSQPVVAYALEQQDASVGKRTTAAVETNGASHGWALAPNATDDTVITTSAEGEVVINVAAVLLEGGGGDGDTVRLTRLREVQAGVKAAYQQLIPLLRRASNPTADQGPEADLQSLENEISATVDEKTVHANLRRGFDDAKKFLLLELRELQNQARSGRKVEFRSELTKIKAHVEERAAKL